MKVSTTNIGLILRYTMCNFNIGEWYDYSKYCIRKQVSKIDSL